MPVHDEDLGRAVGPLVAGGMDRGMPGMRAHRIRAPAQGRRRRVERVGQGGVPMWLVCPECGVTSYATVAGGRMSGRVVLTHDCPGCGHREIDGDELSAVWARYSRLQHLLSEAARSGRPVPPEEIRRMQLDAADIRPERPEAPFTDELWPQLEEYWKREL